MRFGDSTVAVASFVLATSIGAARADEAPPSPPPIAPAASNAPTSQPPLQPIPWDPYGVPPPAWFVPTPQPDQVERSTAGRSAGQALTGVGIAHMIVGIGLFTGFGIGIGGGVGYAYGAVFGSPFVFDGSILLSIGLPLWMVNRERISPEERPVEESRAPVRGVGFFARPVTIAF